MNDEFMKLRLENLRLKQENLQLKKLLKANNIVYDTEEEKEFTTKLTSKDKLEIFMSYFRGRDDVYAYKYFKNGKKAYAKASQYGINLKLTNEIYFNHMKADSNFSIGIYPLVENNKCYFLCIDFDDDHFAEAALAFKIECDKHNIDTIMEKSQSGNGIHIWMFFENAVKAAKARLLGDYLLSEAMSNNKYISFKSYDRMFPSQDFVKDDKLGNLIALPLDGYSVKKFETTVIVDDNFKMINNQIGYLSKIKKISADRLNELIELITKLNKSIDSYSKLIKKLRLDKSDFPNGLNLVLRNDIFVSKNNISPKGLYFLKRLAVVNNPEFYEKQALRLSVYNVNRFIELFYEYDDYISLPRGILLELTNSLTSIGIDYNIVDERVKRENINVKFIGDLKEEQEKAVLSLLKFETGILQAPTGSGKTIMALDLIAKISKPTLIIVESINILKQWNEKIKQFMSICDGGKPISCGVYYSSKKNLTGIIDIVSIKSLDGLDLNQNYELIIADEVHHMASIEYEKIIRRLNCRYFYGLTATPKRSDKLERINYMSIGPVRYVMESVSTNIVKYVKPIFTKMKNKEEYDLLSYSDILSELINDEERNEIISNDILMEYDKGKNILVLTKRIDHINVLKSLLGDKCNNVITISGTNSSKEKKEFTNTISKLNRQYIIISTGDYLGEGFDLPHLNTLFIAMPIKWEGLHKQYLGRIEREHHDKNEIYVYDYVDVKIPMFARMFTHRLKEYKRENYVLIDLNDKPQIIYSFNEFKNQIDAELSQAMSIKLLINYAKKEFLDYYMKFESKIEIITDECLDISPTIKIIKSNAKINAIVIDDKVLWYGSINPFSFNQKEETIIRIDDKEYVNEILSGLIGD